MKVLTLILLLVACSFADEYRQSNINFSSELYTELLKIKSGNFLVCPLSAQIALSLLTLGARGNTAKELAAGLSLPQDVAKIQNIFDTLSAQFEVTEPYQLTSANKIYLAKGYTIKKNYKDLAVNTYKSDIVNINFEDNENAAKQINAWIESKTKNKIKNLINKNLLSGDTAAVIVNAMYFHGFWLNEFGKNDDYKAPFYITPTKSVKVEVFGGRNYFNYYENKKLNARFLEMPFVGNEATMTYVLPNEKDGLAQLETSMSEVLTEQPYIKQDVVVEFPKFTMETNVDLKSILKSLGVHDAFTSSANFNGISDTNIKISEVLQKNFIQVNERGATAASATAGIGMVVSMPRAFFYANHPYIFFLKHKVHGVMFIGRYTNPEN